MNCFMRFLISILRDMNLKNMLEVANKKELLGLFFLHFQSSVTAIVHDNAQCLQEYRSWVDVLSDHAYPMALDSLATAADTAAELGLPPPTLLDDLLTPPTGASRGAPTEEGLAR